MAYYLRLSDDEAIEFIKLKNDQILQIYIMLLFLKRAEINLFTKKVSPQRNLKHIAPMSWDYILSAAAQRDTLIELS